MKSYEEMSGRVFERMAEYETKKKKRNKMIGRVSVTACGLAAVIAIGGVLLPKNAELTANGGTEYTEGGKPIYNGAFVPGDEDFDGSGEEYKDGDWWVSNDAAISDFPELKEQEQSVESSSAEENPFIGHAPNQPFGSETSDLEYLTWIEDYPMPGGAAACYKSPANGEWYMTIPLKGAIGEYGGEEVIYRVAVRVFDDGKWLRDAKTLKEEFARLGGLGYTAVFETFTDNGTSTYQLSLHATDEQLLNFVPDPDYGYVLILYKEALHEEQGW